MTRVILLAALLLTAAWAFWRLVDGVIETFGGTTESKQRKRRGGPAVKLTRDPVCGTWVSPNNARHLQAGSTIHFFCSDECLRKFQSR